MDVLHLQHLIWFAGHGEVGTGNWMIGNDTITFEDVLELYEKFFFNRILYIVCDCCYSGRWVTKLAERLDKMKIGACGHQAKKIGYFLKVVASCKEDEEDRDGVYIKAEGVCATKDHSIHFTHKKYLWGGQHTLVLDTTSMRCFRDPSGECLLNKMEYFHQWKWSDLLQGDDSLSKRFEFVCSSTHWYAVLFHKDKCSRIANISEEKLKTSGFIVAKGTEIFPPKEVVSKLCLYSPFNYNPYDLHKNTPDSTNYICYP